MTDYIRRERPAYYESLTARIERGEQVIQDADTGELRIVGVRDTRRRNPANEEEDSRAALILENDDSTYLED